MRKTEYDPIPHASDVPHVQDTPIPPPAPASEDSEQRHALAVQARAVAQAAPEVRVAKVEAARAPCRKGPSRWTGRPWRRSSLRRSVRSAGTPERGDAVGPAWVSERRQPRRRPPRSPHQALSSRLQPASLLAGVPCCCCHCASAACACSQRAPCPRLPDAPPSGYGKLSSDCSERQRDAP